MLNEVQIVCKFLSMKAQIEKRGLNLEVDGSEEDGVEPNFLLISKDGNHCFSSDSLHDIEVTIRGFGIFLNTK